MPPKVLLADDHAAFRAQVKALLTREGFPVVGQAANGRDALKLARKLHPDVAILDISMPILNGLETARKMPRVSPHTKMILLTVHSEISYVLEALEAGVSGYVVKRRAAEELPQAVRVVSGCKCYLCSIASQVVRQALPKETTISKGQPKLREDSNGEH